MYGIDYSVICANDVEVLKAWVVDIFGFEKVSDHFLVRLSRIIEILQARQAGDLLGEIICGIRPLAIQYEDFESTSEMLMQRDVQI